MERGVVGRITPSRGRPPITDACLVSGARRAAEPATRAAPAQPHRRALDSPCPAVPAARAIRAFTLIEVMLCVGIIAVLAGIVFAALGPVRERARVTTCTSNLHQIWAAYAMYAADHDGA
ncbi:MAG: prepilin-type N-terminal cleavage/methylation domain-containing protein, partial [Chthonomonadales bacterium]|nr:prepilin-type N-terminal cleavage/methylation domain-containing protein [Chthonomonadales bacterium]